MLQRRRLHAPSRTVRRKGGRRDAGLRGCPDRVRRSLHRLEPQLPLQGRPLALPPGIRDPLRGRHDGTRLSRGVRAGQSRDDRAEAAEHLDQPCQSSHAGSLAQPCHPTGRNVPRRTAELPELGVFSPVLDLSCRGALFGAGTATIVMPTGGADGRGGVRRVKLFASIPEALSLDLKFCPLASAGRATSSRQGR